MYVEMAGKVVNLTCCQKRVSLVSFVTPTGCNKAATNSLHLVFDSLQFIYHHYTKPWSCNFRRNLALFVDAFSPIASSSSRSGLGLQYSRSSEPMSSSQNSSNPMLASPILAQNRYAPCHGMRTLLNRSEVSPSGFVSRAAVRPCRGSR